MEYIKKLSRFIIPYKNYAYLNIFFNVLYALFSTLGMLSLMPMINVLFGENEQLNIKPIWNGISSFDDFKYLKPYLEDSLNYFITTTTNEFGPHHALMYMIILIISIFLFKNIFNYLALYFIAYLRNGVLKDLRNEVYDKVLNLPISFYSERKKGDVIARITNDVAEIQNSLLAILEIIVKEPLTILFSIIVMFGISTELTLFVFIFIPISGFIISIIGKTLKKFSKNVQDERGVFLSTLEETLSGLKVIKGFNAEKTFNSKFQESTTRFYNFTNTLVHRQNLAAPTSEFFRDYNTYCITMVWWRNGSCR